MRTILLIIFAVIIIAIWCAVSISSETDERVQRMLLRREALEKYPQLRLSSALDNLYLETLRQIKVKAKDGDVPEELVERLTIILNERNECLSEEIDKESSIGRVSS
ncbi:MAG: hypothetical protein KBG83_00060 [Bacteroidetes bacterium]|nr:hypothetical protein [Bacteroidota bacterium]